MFTPEFFIDALQDAKRTVTNRVITDKTLNKVANTFIDAQTVFAKMLVNNTVTLCKYTADSFADQWFPSNNKADKSN
jgi:hypothetical protein